MSKTAVSLMITDTNGSYDYKYASDNKVMANKVMANKVMANKVMAPVPIPFLTVKCNNFTASVLEILSPSIGLNAISVKKAIDLGTPNTVEYEYSTDDAFLTAPQGLNTIVVRNTSFYLPLITFLVDSSLMLTLTSVHLGTVNFATLDGVALNKPIQLGRPGGHILNITINCSAN